MPHLDGTVVLRMVGLYLIHYTLPSTNASDLLISLLDSKVGRSVLSKLQGLVFKGYEVGPIEPSISPLAV